MSRILSARKPKDEQEAVHEELHERNSPAESAEIPAYLRAAVFGDFNGDSEEDRTEARGLSQEDSAPSLGPWLETVDAAFDLALFAETGPNSGVLRETPPGPAMEPAPDSIEDRDADIPLDTPPLAEVGVEEEPRAPVPVDAVERESGAETGESETAESGVTVGAGESAEPSESVESVPAAAPGDDTEVAEISEMDASLQPEGEGEPAIDVEVPAADAEAPAESEQGGEQAAAATPAEPDSMAALRTEIDARAQAIPPPRISHGGGGGVTAAAAVREEEIHFTEPAIVASAEAELPPTPDNMPIPAVPTEENPVPTATQRVEDTSGQILPEQTFNVLEQTPLGNTTRLGARPLSAERIREAHHVLDDGEMVSMEDDPRQPLLNIRDAMLNPPDVTEAESGAATLAPHPPRPVPTPTATARTQLAGVFARLLARPGSEAEQMLSRARQAAFPGGTLERELPSYGNDAHLAGLTEELTTQYRDIATQAGVAAGDLDSAIANRQEVLREEELAAREDLVSSSTDGSELVCEAHDDLSSTITTETARINASADAVASEGGGGSYADHIHAQRDSMVRRVTRRAAEIDAAYRRAKEDRDRELDTAQTQRLDAYRAAAQMDAFQLNEMSWLPAERQTRFRELYTDETGADPSEESGLTQIEINTLERASTTWADERAVAVREEVRLFKEAVGNSTSEWRTAAMDAADTSRTEIRTWDENESGETRGWWQELWDWVGDWVDQAHANADAWQTQQNQEHATEVVTDLNLLDRLTVAADRGITEEQERELNSLTGDQRQIVQAFFTARSRHETVDPIAMVADLTRARIWNERRQNLIQRLEDTFLGDDSIAYATIDTVVGRAVSGLTGNLYSAFHGEWGLLSEAGTDEDAVYAALEGLNHVQSIAIRNIYRRRYGVTLESELRDELSGGELHRAEALLSGNRAEAAAATLYTAMHETFLGTGAGTDEATIHATLRGLSAEERAEVTRIYHERYGLDLATDTSEELDDWATIGTRDSERADAELHGNLERADALEIEEELQGSWFHTSTTTTVASVYERLRREVQAQATRENRDSAWMEAEITRRSSGIESSYDLHNVESGATLASDIESGTRAEAQFWGNLPQNQEASRDYLTALSVNDMAAADAAHIRIERTSIVYASDSVITGTLSSNYDRALAAERLDYAPERRRALLAELNARERADDHVWTAAERWAANQEIERQIEHELIDRARPIAEANLGRMEDEYSTRYGESASTAILESTSFTDNEMASTMLDQGGYLDPYQTFDYATRRLNTDEEAAARAFSGLTAEEIAVYDDRWQREHGGQTLRGRASSTMSGRDWLDVDVALDGTPATIDDEIARMRRRVAFERPTNALGGLLAETERGVMEDQLARMESMAALMHAPPQGSTDDERRRARDGLLEDFDTQTSLVSESIEHHRHRTDALVDSITTAVGIVVAVVVGVVGSFFTGGAAGAVALAIIASLASTAATIGTRALLKGNAYGWEDFAVDVGVGLVDAVVAALTAGLGDKLLGIARPAGQQAVRSATATGLRGAWQRVVLSLNRSAARLGETGLLTRAARPIGALERMAAREASLLSRGAAHVMAQTAENFIQSVPSTALSVALDDNTWKGPGNPLVNLLSGTAQGLGPGLVMGLAMSGAHAAAGHVRGVFAGPRLGVETHLRIPERPGVGTPEYHARMAEWNSTHPGRPEAEFRAHMDSEFETAVRAAEAQRAVRRDVANHLEDAFPPADRGMAAEIPVTVVSDMEFRSLNNWRAGDATVVVRDGQVHIAVREGAPPHAVRAQLDAQVDRLRNLVEPGTGGRVRDPHGALPRDLRGRISVEIDPDLPPRTVRVEHDPYPRIVAGRGARASDIRMHVETARNVLQLHGAYGRVRHLLDRFADWAFLHGEPPQGTRAWEARQELRKLPEIIEARMNESVHPDLTAHERTAIEADIADLRNQLAVHRATLADLDMNPARGFIAAEGRAVPTRAELDAAHESWVDQMRAAIRGEGPPPPAWRGPEPELDHNGSWRGHSPAEAYAAYRAALREGGGRYEAIITRDRITGEYQVMLGRQASVAPPAATPGRSWETVMHFHPNQEGALRYTLPAQQDLWLAMTSHFAEGHPRGTPHVEFVESVINGERTRVAIVVDGNGMRLEISRGAAGTAGPVAVSEVVPIHSLEDYLAWWRSQDAGTPLRPPSDPSDTRWVAPGSQEYRDLMHGSARELGHEDVAGRIDADAPERAGVPAESRTMTGEVTDEAAALRDATREEAVRAHEQRNQAIDSELSRIDEDLAEQRRIREDIEARGERRMDDARTSGEREEARRRTARSLSSSTDRINRLEGQARALRDERYANIRAVDRLRGERLWEHHAYRDLGDPQIPPCFAADTAVHTPTGVRPIESLEPGDLVLATDPRTGTIHAKPVTRVHRGWTQSLVILSAGGRVRATRHHPVWSVAGQRWMEAYRLHAGDAVRNLGGEIRIEDCNREYEVVETWSLEVAELHTFHVGPSGLLVHNGGADSGWMSQIRRDTYIYAIRERATGRIVYVGKTRQEEGDRFGQHVSSREHWSDVTHEEIVLHRGDWTDFETAVWEQHFINMHGGARSTRPGSPLENEVNPLTMESYREYRRYHHPC